MDPDRYRRMLAELSRNIGEKDLKALKFMCLEDIPRARQEEITDAYQLWIALEERDCIGPGNLTFLRKLLAQIAEGRTVLTKILDSYCVGLPQGFEESRHVGTEARQDLGPEVKYLSSNLGKNWRQVMRQLRGVTEADIDEAVERHPRALQEQIRSCLRTWLTRAGVLASRAALISACEECDMNLHAENLRDMEGRN